MKKTGAELTSATYLESDVFFEQGRLRLSRQRDHNLTQLGLSAELDWDLAVTVKAD